MMVCKNQNLICKNKEKNDGENTLGLEYYHDPIFAAAYTFEIADNSD